MKIQKIKSKNCKNKLIVYFNSEKSIKIKGKKMNKFKKKIQSQNKLKNKTKESFNNCN